MSRLPEGWTVTLEPHVGIKRAFDQGGNVIGNVPVNLAQQRIRVSTPEREEQGIAPLMFGYVCDKPGSPINCIASLPDEIVEAVAEEVCTILGQDRRLTTPTGFVPPPEQEKPDEAPAEDAVDDDDEAGD